MSKTAILILAAGESRRMGQPKQLLPYKDSNLLLQKINEVQKLEDVQVFVVLGAFFNEIFPLLRELPVTVVMNTKWQEGMGSSLSKGIGLIQKKGVYDRVLITLADLPLLSASHYLQLISLAKSSGKRIIQTEYDETSGVPVVFDKSLYKELSLLKNEEGAKPLIQKYKKEVLKLRSKTPFFDVDTTESYQKLLDLS